MRFNKFFSRGKTPQSAQASWYCCPSCRASSMLSVSPANQDVFSKIWEHNQESTTKSPHLWGMANIPSSGSLFALSMKRCVQFIIKGDKCEQWCTPALISLCAAKRRQKEDDNGWRWDKYYCSNCLTRQHQNFVNLLQNKWLKVDLFILWFPQKTFRSTSPWSLLMVCCLSILPSSLCQQQAAKPSLRLWQPLSRAAPISG